MLSRERIVRLLETEHKGRYVNTFGIGRGLCALDIVTDVKRLQMEQAVRKKVSFSIGREILLTKETDYPKMLEDVASDIWNMLYRSILEALYDIESECKYGDRESALDAIQTLREKMINEP